MAQTHSQVAAPSSLADAPSTVFSLLPDVFAMLHEPWARNFMFNMNAVADVSTLTNATQLQHGVVTQSLNSFRDMQGESSGFFNMDVETQWLVVPVYSVGHISAEIIVQAQNTVNNTLFYTSFNNTSVIRMLRNNTTGDLLIGRDDEKIHQISLFYFHCRSTTKRHRIVLCGKRDAILEAMVSGYDIDFRKVLRSLALAIDVHECRPCPSCRSAPENRCNCQLSFSRPSHPMDFTFFRSNVACHAGHFAGNATTFMLLNGKCLTKGVVSCTTATNYTLAPGILQRLAEFGIKLRMYSHKVAPRAPLVPSFSPEEIDLCISQNTCQKPTSHSQSISFRPEDTTSLDAALSSALERSFNNEHGLNLSSWTRNHLPPRGNVPQRLVEENVSLAVEQRHVTASTNPLIVAAAEKIVMEQAARVKEIEDRKQERIRKNREAAARSYLRRKEHTDSLKTNLEAVRNLRSQLQQREAALKSENENLRKLL